ncbi:hypothetical protein [Photobacterium kishitanii]|nr:hypothetical protein [Photobacterium kishitanii]
MINSASSVFIGWTPKDGYSHIIYPLAMFAVFFSLYKKLKIRKNKITSNTNLKDKIRDANAYVSYAYSAAVIYLALTVLLLAFIEFSNKTMLAVDTLAIGLSGIATVVLVIIAGNFRIKH